MFICIWNIEVVISRIYIDPWVLTPNVVVTQQKQPTRIDGTDITETGVINKNFSSHLILLVDLFISDASSDMTFNNGINYHAFPAKSMTSQTRDMKGTNIISPGETIGWGWKTVDGGNATDGEVISLSVNCYERKVEQ